MKKITNIQHGISNDERKINEQKKENRENNQKKFDLQERFIDYAVRIINVSEQLPETKAGKHVSFQLLRSGTCPAGGHSEKEK